MAFTRILGPGIHTASNINSHNINSTGIITATAFVGNLTGNVTGGASSITGSPSVSLGNVNAGIATFTGALTGTTANFSGNVSVGGVLTYEDVKNVDSLGIITARSGVDVDDFLDVGSNIKLGNSGVITATTFKGDGDFVELDVDGHTNLDNVSIAGVATATLFSGASQIGIQSAGTQIGAGITQLNFVGTGNTFAVNGTTVDISIAGGGGGTGAGGTWSTYTAGIATSKSVGVNTSNLDDTDLTGIGNSFKGLYISNGMIVHDNVLNGNHYIGTSMNGLMAGPVTIDGNLEIDGNYVVV
nr:phage tail fiber-like protein [uncultured Mediterranean phage uvMED]